MESAHITETVEGVDPASVEPVTVRVHSRKHSRALDPQGLYQQALNGQALNEQELDQQVLGEQESGHQVFDRHQSGLQEPAQQQIDQAQQQLDQHRPAAQAPDPQSGEDEVFETASCESFDASPVEQAEEEETAKAKTPTGHSGIIDGGDSVSKKDLVALLESFVRVIKTDDVDTSNGTGSNHGVTTGTGSGTGIELSSDRGMITNEARVDDRTVEIDQLRGLVIEAQDTIIKLLTDRVDDRSRIATLEAQLNLLPDLQAQADRAMSVAVRTEEYRSEINKMKFELDRFRLFRVRVEAEQKKGSVFNRIQKWLFSRPNAKDETLQRNSYQKMVDQSHIQPNIQPIGETNVQANL